MQSFYSHSILIVFLFLVLSATNGQLPLSKVQGVTVTTSVQDSSPALRVSWSTVNGSDITYTVSYSTTSGTQSDPPSKANCGTSGITGTSTTLAPLSRGTTYYIWVGAVSLSGRGPYSERISAGMKGCDCCYLAIFTVFNSICFCSYCPLI